VTITWGGNIGFVSTNTLQWNANDGNSSSPKINLWQKAMRTVANPITMDGRLDGYYGTGCRWQQFNCYDVYFRGNMSEFERVFLGALREALQITTVSGDNGFGESYIYLAHEYSSYYNYASQNCQTPGVGSGDAFVCNTMNYVSAAGYDADAQQTQGSYETRLSWTIPRSIFMEDNPTLTEEFFANPLLTYVSGHVLGGRVGRVATDATAVNPSLRNCGLEMLIVPEMDPSPDNSMPNFQAFLQQYLPVPQDGPIFNHDARNLAVLTPLGATAGQDWQQMYWGSNLPRLQGIKATYDPTALFTCRDCLTAHVPTPTPPSPTPTPPTPGTPTSGVSFKAILTQTVTFSIEVARYTGQVKEAYDNGYASFLGIYDSSTNSLIAGCSLQSTASASRRGSAIAYSATIIESLLAAASSSANGASAASVLQATVNSVIAAAYGSAAIPAAVVSAITKAVVTVVVDASGLAAGYGYISQAVTFPSTVLYSDADTKLSYDKGYGSFLDIYSSGNYAADTSVAGIATSSRRSSTTINWLTVLTCATYDAAYSASSSKDLNALKAAIQNIIAREYPSVVTAVKPSLMSSISGALAASCGGDDGLSGGDIAGIVIGSVFGFALIVAIIYFLVCRSPVSDGDASKPDAQAKASQLEITTPAAEEQSPNDKITTDSAVRI